jgi:hypothetical protein
MLVLFVVLGLSLSFWTIPAAAQPQPPEIHRFIFRGLSASAAFSSIDETECIVTDVFVTGTDGMVRVDGQPDVSSEAFLDISRFDSCTGEQLLIASGFTILPPEEFEIDPELSQAALNTTFVVEDFFSGDTFRVDVSLTWTGTGDVSTQTGVFHSKSPGSHVIAAFRGTFREGEASGSIAGMDTEFATEPSVFAQLADVMNGEVMVIHNP